MMSIKSRNRRQKSPTASLKLRITEAFKLLNKAK